MHKWTFKDFMDDVYSQLECNASDEYKSKYNTFTYSNETVRYNERYFRQCYKDGLSAYMALTLAMGFLNDEGD